MTRPACIVLAMSLAACASDALRAPTVPAPDRYTPGPAVEQTVAAGDFAGGAAQRFVPGGDVPAAWWTLFRSPALDALVRQALEVSPTLARAGARLRQAEEERQARAGATQVPRVDARLSGNRIDVNPAALGSPRVQVATPFNLYLASVGVSYTFDVFGANRRELEALAADVEHERYALEGARLVLAGNVVTAAIREASLREQIAMLEAMVDIQQRQLAISERLEQIGTAAPRDVVARRLALAQSRALLPAVERQREEMRHRLAVYTGQAPGTAELPLVSLADLQLPAELPLVLPSELARQRPDIRAAEALLKQAAARVGVATANLYPQLTLSATAGSLGTQPGDLFGGTAFYLLGASLTQPLLRGGELQARHRAAIAAYDQAGAAYQEVVLQGLQNVADVLRALDADARTLQERADAAAQAQRHRDIAAARYQAGGVSLDTLLDAERTLLSALMDRRQAVADRHADSAALLQALGGGWWTGEQARGSAKP